MKAAPGGRYLTADERRKLAAPAFIKAEPEAWLVYWIEGRRFLYERTWAAHDEITELIQRTEIWNLGKSRQQW